MDYVTGSYPVDAFAVTAGVVRGFASRLQHAFPELTPTTTCMAAFAAVFFTCRPKCKKRFLQGPFRVTFGERDLRPHQRGVSR